MPRKPKLPELPERLLYPTDWRDRSGRRVPFTTVEAAAASFGIKEEGLRQRIRRGIVPAVKRRDERNRPLYLLPVLLAELEASRIAAYELARKEIAASEEARLAQEAKELEAIQTPQAGRSVDPDKPCVEPSPKPSTMGREEYMRRRKAGEEIPADQIPPPMSSEEYGRRIRRGEDIPAELAPPTIVDLGPGWIPAGDPTITIPDVNEPEANA